MAAMLYMAGRLFCRIAWRDAVLRFLSKSLLKRRSCARAARFRSFICAGVLASLITGNLCQAVIFYSTADPSHNTTAPDGELAGSGWEFQGNWKGFLGTAIGPDCFITAKHLGGVVGENFRFRGVDYPTVAFFDNSDADLRIWKIRGTLPGHAALYGDRDEVGKRLVVFGRGTQRGEEVRVGSLLSSELKGWRWGASDGKQRWGENRVGSVIQANGAGELLRVAFDADGGANEAHLSIGDSGGAIFIHDGSAWKLAGINYAVEGPYSMNGNDGGFEAAVFDEGGLYKKSNGTWSPTPDLPVSQAGAFYATRISSHVSWIKEIISRAPPVSTQPILQSSRTTTGAFADERSARIDESARSITLPLPDGVRFFRISAPSQLRISEVRVVGGNLRLNYE